MEMQEVGGRGSVPSNKMNEPREVGNAGLVRPTNGLGLEPDWIDCPNCNLRRKTEVVGKPSEHTTYVTYSNKAIYGLYSDRGLANALLALD